LSTLEDSFTSLLGRQPNDKERQALLRARDALNLKNNDALWLVLMALGHYETVYREFPALIARAAADVTTKAKDAAETELKAAAARTRSELAKAVAQSAHDIADRSATASRFQWTAVCAIAMGAMFLSIGAVSYRAGKETGDASGYSRGLDEMRDEKAAAAWANTPEGQLGYGLAKAGSLRRLAECSGRGWRLKGRTCVPQGEKGFLDGWSVVVDPAREK
jgi:hypothetical protein